MKSAFHTFLAELSALERISDVLDELIKQPERKPVTDTQASVSGCLSFLLMFQQRVDFILEDCCPRSSRYA